MFQQIVSSSYLEQAFPFGLVSIAPLLEIMSSSQVSGGRPAQPQDVSADVEDLVHPDRSGMVRVTYSSSNNPGSGKWMKMDENESLPDSFTVMSSSTSMIIGTTWQNSQFETRFF